MEPISIILIIAALMLVGGFLLWLNDKKDKFAYLAGAGFLLLIVSIFFGGLSGLGITGEGIPTIPTPTTPSTEVVCPTTEYTSTTVTVINPLNVSTTDDEVKPTLLAKGRTSGYVTTLTSGTAANLPCGEVFDVYAISSTTAQGRIRGTLTPVPPDASVANGYLTIRPSGSNYAVSVTGARSSAPKIRVYDKDANAFGYMSDTGTAGVYSATGTTVKDGTNTTWAIGTGGTAEYKFDIQSTTAYTDYNDFGVLLGMDLISTEYDAPVIKMNGQVLPNVKGTLTPAEERGLSSYEFVYRIPQGVPIENVNYATVDVTIKALGGVDSSTDWVMLLATAGQFQKTMNSNEVSIGAYKDDASTTVTVSANTFTFDAA